MFETVSLFAKNTEENSPRRERVPRECRECGKTKGNLMAIWKRGGFPFKLSHYLCYKCTLGRLR